MIELNPSPVATTCDGESQGMIIECPCRLEAVRDSARMFRSFLAANGAEESEINDWELVIVEAGNNAVEHAVTPEEQQRGVRFLINAWPDTIELCVTDHSLNFELPKHVRLPPDDAERGRGLYLMSVLTDSMRYLRGRKENLLILRRRRACYRRLTDVQRGADLEHTLQKMTEELGASFESLSAIFRFSSELGRSECAKDCAKRWLDEVMRVTETQWYLLRQYHPEDHSLRLLCSSAREDRVKLIEPVVYTRGNGPISAEISAVLEAREIWFDGSTPANELASLEIVFGNPLSGFSYPIYIGRQLFGVLTIGMRQSRVDFTVSQVNLIHTFADFLGIQLSNDQVRGEAIQARLVNREIKVAADIQRSLLPKVLPGIPGFTLAAHSENAHTMGGDFYDVIQVGNEGVLFAIADVMGKGVPAAIFAAMFRSHLHACTEHRAAPGAMLTWLNKALFTDLDNVDVFVTAQLAYFDIKTRTLTIASAGHCPAMLCEGMDGHIRELYCEGQPLGIGRDTVYQEEVIKTEKPCRFLMFTDGLVEARNTEGRMIGQVAVSATFAQSARLGMDASVVRNDLLRLIAGHHNGMLAADDISFLLLVEDEPPPSTTEPLEPRLTTPST